jgi:ribonuclease HI
MTKKWPFISNGTESSAGIPPSSARGSFPRDKISDPKLYGADIVCVSRAQGVRYNGSLDTDSDWHLGAEKANNNTAELTGIIESLALLKTEGGQAPAVIAYDSEYAARATQGRKGKTNHKLIETAQRLLEEERERRGGGVTFVHVFAHNGEIWNEHADLLVQYGKGSIKLPEGDRVPWEGAATSRLHISRAETAHEHAERQHARAARADHQRKHINSAFAAGNVPLPMLPAALTLIGIAAAATGAMTSIVASTARTTRAAWANITHARSQLTAVAQHRIEMNKQTAMARREVVKQSSLTVQERMRICKNRCAAMERKQLRQQRRSATNHQPYGTYRITDGSPVANTTPPPSPPPPSTLAVTTALNINDLISHHDIGNLIMNECGVLDLGRLSITNKASTNAVTRYNLRSKRIFPINCGGFDQEYATFWATVDRERATERDDRRGEPQEAIRAYISATSPTTPRAAIRTPNELQITTDAPRTPETTPSPSVVTTTLNLGEVFEHHWNQMCNPQATIRAFVSATAQTAPRTPTAPMTPREESPLGLAQRMRGGEHNVPWTPPTTPESPRNNFTPVYWERPSPFTFSMLAPDIIIESTPEPRVLVAETPTPRSTMSIDASPYVPSTVWTNGTTAGRDDCTPGLPSAILPTAVLNFEAMPPSEVRDRGHLVLTPLILAQPEEVVPTAAVSEKNGLEGGWEGVEAMDMVR